MDDKKLLVKGINCLILLFIIGLIGLSLYSYSPSDPFVSLAPSKPVHIHNKAGFIGAFISGILVKFLGLGSWVLLVLMFLWLLKSLIPSFKIKWYRWLSLLILFATFMWLFSFPALKKIALCNIKGGGIVGDIIYKKATFYLQRPGAILLLVFLILICVYVLTPNTFVKVINLIKPKSKEEKKSEEKVEAEKKIVESHKDESYSNRSIAKDKIGAEEKSLKVESHRIEKAKRHRTSQLIPPIDLLNPLPKEAQEDEKDTAQIKTLTEKIHKTLSEFGIQGEIVHVNKGPVITVFEYKPAPGIKISKIASLNHDLALALKAHSIRIEAPIAGKDLIGIEVPNKNRKVVYLRAIIESKDFQSANMDLPLALGVDVLGRPKVVDLARMPHLLVAGATGSGKSVCLNCLIISLVFKKSPAELKFILVDPKRIELALYSDLPHLIHPVITDMNLAKLALDWVVNEMEKRYEAMAKLSVRNIEGYNQKASSDPDLGIEPMPYLVVIIDELADLMLTLGKEVEFDIVRLAQLARASGIHVILATQRPSVDVVTGLIKANFPSRIAFSVTSKHDSRTILDTVGAEYLLGKGDMLFKPTAGNIERVHGAYVSDEEISRVITFWKENWEEEEKIDFRLWKRSKETDTSEEYEDILNDPLYDKAVDFVMRQGKASISMIQRHLRIGFNRAARFIEQMERDGIIGPQEGSKPREVIKKHV